jgi:signal transduction histidine kinase
VAAILAYLGAYRERTRARLGKLAAWPLGRSAVGDAPPMAEALEHAVDVLGATQLIVVWQERFEEAALVAYWTGSACEVVKLPALPAEASTRDQTVAFVAGRQGETKSALASILKHVPAGRVSPGLAQDVERYSTAPIQSSHYVGRVWVFKPRYSDEDILSLTEIVASRIASDLERFWSDTELASATTIRERAALARDMHDSVLQDLTAASLKLSATTGKMPVAMQAPLREIGALLLQQQKRIRHFVETTRPQRERGLLRLGDQLEAFLYALSKQWQCEPELAIEPPDLQVEGWLVAELCQILSEATANAVRHGNASRVEVVIKSNDSRLSVSIADNGRGAASVDAEPHSIKERVKGMGGRFRVDGRGPGFGMTIEVPGE